MAGIDSSSTSRLLDILFEEGVGRCLVAPDGSIVRVNREWLRSTGFELDDVLGADVIALFPDTRDMALAMHARARAGHRVEVPRHALLLHGRETWWEGSIEPVPMGDGTGLLVTAREVGGAERAAGSDAAGSRAPTPSPSVPLAPLVARAFADTLEALQEGFFVLDREWRVVFANRTAGRDAGVELAELVGQVIWDRFPSLRGTPVEAAYRRVMAERVPLSVEIQGTLSDRWYRLRISPTEPGLSVLWTDVTDRRRADDLLKAQLEVKEQLAKIAASVPGAICSFQLRPDGTACMPFGAEALDELYGIPREVLARDMGPCFANFHPDDVAAVQASIAASKRDMSKWHAEYRYLHPTKGLRWIEGWSIPLAEPDGSVLWHGYVTDITASKQAADALRDSEEKLRLAKEAAQMGAWDWDLATGELVWSDRCKALFGLPPETRMSHEVFLRAVHEDDRAAIEAAIRTALSSRQPYDVEMRVPTADGSVRWIALKGLGSYDARGRPVRMAGMALDVTSRKRAEERDRAAAARDAFRVRLSDALRPLADPEDIRATASRLIATFLGVSRAVYGEVEGEEVVATDDYHLDLGSVAGRHRIGDYGPAIAADLGAGRTFVVADVDASSLAPAERAGYAALSVRAHVTVPLRKGGRLVACLTVAAKAPRAWPEEEVALVEEVAERTWVAVERARDQAALRDEARRKDEFLAVLSHELRNPLAPIRNSIYLLERTAPGSAQAARAVEVLRRQTEHVTRLVDDLLDVTRISRGKVTLRRERLDLREVVRKTADDHQSLFDESGVDLRVEYPGKPVWVIADPTRVAQVLANLLHNAVKFTPRGGRVSVSAAARQGRAQLRVRDDGLGIDAAQLERMFEPFAQADQGIARTKGGLGLGLALVKGIVELHGGTVSARSDGTGHGAEFVVSLPVAASEAGTEPGPGVAQGAAARDVLVIEDNRDAAETLADVLTLLGHRVRVAADGRGGLALAREQRPDVILCDIGLPDVDGYEVARAVRRDAALDGTRLVALTGYAQPEDRQRALDAGFDAHLPKPPAPEALERVLAE